MNGIVFIKILDELFLWVFILKKIYKLFLFKRNS